MEALLTNRRPSTARSLLVVVLPVFLLAACGAGTSTQDGGDQTKPIPPAAPAPGSASILGEVLGCDALSDQVSCRVSVQNVMAYGSATPQLPPGTEIAIEIRNLSRVPAEIADDSGAPRIGVYHMLVVASGTPGSPRSWQLMTIATPDA